VEDEQYDLTDFEATLRNDFAKTIDFLDPSLVIMDTSIFDLGFSSMEVFRLKHHINTRLGTTVPNIVFLKQHSVRLLAACLTKMTVKTPSPSDSAFDILGPDPRLSSSESEDNYNLIVVLCPKGPASSSTHA
jgi:hypothetical protein